MRRVLSIVLVAVLAPPVARAQVVANPNQIRGHFDLRNTNPEIVALLQAQGLELLGFRATSSSGLTATTSGVVIDGLHATYEITVEGGVPGIPYSLRAMPFYRGASARDLVLSTPPIEPEPAPDVDLDFSECMGLVRLHLVDMVGDPVIGANATVNGRPAPPDSDLMDWLIPDGLGVSFIVNLRTGSDPLSDTVVIQYHATTAIGRCDEVQTIDCVVDAGACNGGEGIHFGRIVGELDVLGATIVPIPPSGSSFGRPLVSATNGPYGNLRYDDLHDPSRLRGAYELENLVASETVAPPKDYFLDAMLSLDVGGAVESLRFPTLGVLVPGDTTLDLGDLLVIDPSDVRADVRVVGPPPSPARGRALLDGMEGTARSEGTRDPVPGTTWVPRPMYASVDVVDETYDDARSTFEASWRLLLGGVRRGPSVHALSASWSATYVDDPSVPTDPYYAGFGFLPAGTEALALVPGSTHDLRYHACVGQVRMGFRSTGALFYRPSIRAVGAFSGIDFEGNATAYEAGGTGTGLPARDAPAATGHVDLCLPEGEYVLTPQASFVNPGGGVSTTTLPPIPLHVGCRQVLTGSPQIVAQMTEAPSCVGTAPITVAGAVRADEEIASITWSVNGGPETDWCRPCGYSPPYEIVVPGAGAPETQILVKAIDVLGREASVAHHATFSEEPSALDLDASAEPLRVLRDGASGLRATWGSAAAASYSLYAGTIASLHAGRYDHAAFGACGLASSEWSGVAPPGGAYFLVGGACGFGDSTLGRDSFGRPIPGASSRCP